MFGNLSIMYAMIMPRGLVLTRAGESFYKDAKFMIEYNRKAVARARAAMQDETSVVHIGTSP